MSSQAPDPLDKRPIRGEGTRETRGREKEREKSTEQREEEDREETRDE